MARRLRTDFVLLVGGLVVGAAVLLLDAPIPVSEPSTSVVITVVLIRLFCLVAFVGFPLHTFYVDARLARLVPEHRARICPHCRRVMRPEGESLICDCCEQELAENDVVNYWSCLVHSPRLFPPLRPGMPHYRELRDGQPFKLRWRHWLLIALLCLAYPPLTTFQTGRSILSSYLEMLPILLYGLLLGSAFMHFARRWQRIGKSEHCTNCGYQRSPTPDTIEQCPECGSSWNLPGGTIRGKRNLSVTPLIIGVALLLGAAVLIASRGPFWLSPRNWGPSVLPTSSLIHDAIHGTNVSNETWSTLARRKLDSEQQCELFAGLLDRRLREIYIGSTAGAWMWRTVQAGQLPDELIERYYGEMLSIEIDAPDVARVGQPCPLRLSTTFRYSGLPVAVDEFACVGGFEIVGTPQVLARQDHVQSAALLDMPEYVVAASFTPTAPGPVRIRCQVWLTIGDWQGPHEIEWNPGGPPHIPAGSGHTTHLTTERTIEVE